ncbi:hypothetical protein [Mycobacterium sp. AZCC_0083]|uniref:hypothetical protein n=1 Tax=Mycobacterium sp. AZCC_0083 TaxID=2735882 RepID=UPI00161D8E9D|nr:hypothetical protein [Mycobacterium sp. AZCC_0083]MBB5167216.1 hypothetical protein [Mycobacterium sp. AZCC_0083]
MTNVKHRSRSLRIRKGLDICPVSGKRSFASPEAAQSELVAAQRLRAVQRNPHVEKKFYLCIDCMKYHLTSEERSQK